MGKKWKWLYKVSFLCIALPFPFFCLLSFHFLPLLLVFIKEKIKAWVEGGEKNQNPQKNIHPCALYVLKDEPIMAPHCVICGITDGTNPTTSEQWGNVKEIGVWHLKKSVVGISYLTIAVTFTAQVVKIYNLLLASNPSSEYQPKPRLPFISISLALAG